MDRDALPGEGRVLTIEEFERMPDDEWRYELVRGRITREPPAGYGQGRLASRIDRLLGQFVEEHGLGEVVTADTGFVLFEHPPTVRAPDVAFVSSARLPAELPVGFGRFAPDLPIEIVSRSNTLAEIQEKVADYLGAGSRQVWVVDPVRRSVTVYLSLDEIRLVGEGDELDGGDVLPGFRVPVSKLFG